MSVVPQHCPFTIADANSTLSRTVVPLLPLRHEAVDRAEREVALTSLSQRRTLTTAVAGFADDRPLSSSDILMKHQGRHTGARTQTPLFPGADNAVFWAWVWVARSRLHRGALAPAVLSFACDYER